MTKRTSSIYVAAFVLLLSFTFVAHAGHTVNIVAASTPLSDLPWYWNSAVGVWDGGNRMFKPTHGAILFRDGQPIYNDCLYFNRVFQEGSLQACTRETFFASLEWAHWQGSLEIERPSGSDGIIREGHGQGDPNVIPFDPTPPPQFPGNYPKDRDLGPNDALDVFILGSIGWTVQEPDRPFWRLEPYPSTERIYFTDLAEALWAAAGEAQLRVYAQVIRGDELYQELEARRQGRPLFCMWATEGDQNYLADTLDQNGNPKPEENVCIVVDHLEWWLDRVACHWESAFARFPGDWNHYVGQDIDGIFGGPLDGKVHLSEASAYDISLNSYRDPRWPMTPGFVLSGAEDILLYRVDVAHEFSPHCYQLTAPPQGCGSGNWYYLAWSGDPARQYGIYYMPPSASFPLLELYENGRATIPSQPPCLGGGADVEMPNWAYMTSDFNTAVSVAQYAPEVGTFSGQFVFPDEGFIMLVDMETGIASLPIDLSVQLAPPLEIPKSPLASLGLCGPNPFNPTTDIRFEMTQNAAVKLVVFDLLGRQVAVLFDGNAEPGEHRVRFDGTNLASGQYFLRATCGENCLTQKLLLLK